MSAAAFVEQVSKLLQRVQKEVDEGLLPAAQVALAKDGELVFQASYGTAQDDSLTCIFSATKAVTSGCRMATYSRGQTCRRRTGRRYYS